MGQILLEPWGKSYFKPPCSLPPSCPSSIPRSKRTRGKFISIDNDRIRQQFCSKGDSPAFTPRKTTDKAARAPQHAVGDVLQIHGLEQLVHTFESEFGADAGVASEHGVED